MNSEEVGTIWMDSRPWNEGLKDRDSVVVCFCSTLSVSVGMVRPMAIVLGESLLDRYNSITRQPYNPDWAVGKSNLYYLGSHTPVRMVAFVPYCCIAGSHIDYDRIGSALKDVIKCAIHAKWKVIIPQLDLAAGMDEDRLIDILYNAASDAEAECDDTVCRAIVLHTSESQGE